MSTLAPGPTAGEAARSVVAESVKFDQDRLRLHDGLRRTAAVAIPLFGGVVTGQLIAGVAMAVGGLLVGLTDPGGAYRGRSRAMTLTAAGVAVSTLVGELAGPHAVLAVALLGLWCFGAGMFMTMGTPTYMAALMSPLAMTVAVAYPASLGAALSHAAFVFAGGMLQVVLVLVAWRAHPHLPERTAIAALYRELAAWLRDPEGMGDRTPVLLKMTAARRALDQAQGRTAVPWGSGEMFRSLVEEADRTYASMVVLRHARGEVATRGDAAAIDAFDAGRDAAAEALDAIATVVQTGRPLTDAEALRARFAAVGDVLRGELEARRASGDSALAHVIEIALARLDALRGEFRGAVDLAASSRSGYTRAASPVRHRRARPRELKVRGVRPILRANLTLRSSAMRHAIRLAVVVAIAAAIYRAFDLTRGYWVALSVLLILSADFSTTFRRGLQRFIGTVLGVVLASLLTAALHPGPYVLAALITLMTLGSFSLLQANYGLASLCITSWVVLAIAFGGGSEYHAGIDRLLDTLIGSALTFIGYGLWPTWERSLLPSTVAELIDADRRYVGAVFDRWLRPAVGGGHAAIERARSHARVARTNTEASIQRALEEPAAERPGFGTADATGVLSALRRFADGALALEAYLDDRPPAPPAPARKFARELDDSLAELACSADERRAPGPLPHLRQTQEALSGAVGEATPLAEESDRMANSVALLGHVLGRAGAPVGPGAEDAIATQLAARGPDTIAR